MTRDDVRELHYITPTENVPSILRMGLLSHNRAASVEHVSVAMEAIQGRRLDKQIPGARRLHDYVNLYFDAHNPMLSKVRDQNESLCVLRVDPRVLELPDVVIATQNASSDYATFRPVATGLSLIEADRVFARYWIHDDSPFDEWRHKSEKCAEALVPDRVDPSYIQGAYVCNQAALGRWSELRVTLSAEVNHGLFF